MQTADGVELKRIPIEGCNLLYAAGVDGLIYRWLKSKREWAALIGGRGGYKRNCRVGIRNTAYPIVCIGSKVKSVHRLVARAWHGVPKDGQIVNHINGIKADNRPENLEWCTYRENTRHAYAMGLMRKRVSPHSRHFGSDDFTFDPDLDCDTSRRDVTPNEIREAIEDAAARRCLGLWPYGNRQHEATRGANGHRIGRHDKRRASA